MKATEWSFEKIKEAFEVVARDEERMVSIVQEIMFKSADYLRRIIAPVGGQGGVTMSFLQQLLFGGPHLVGLWGKGSNNWWCAICGETYDWKQPDRLMVVQTGEGIEQAKVFKAH